MQDTAPDSQPAAAAADAPAAGAAPVPAPAPPPAPRSIGERLRAGRERAGLSLPAAAEKLHLDPRVIEALEANRFAELGAAVYVRGHLRRYGDFVGESGIELVNLYLAREADAPSPDLTQVPQAERHSNPRRLAAPLLGLGCAAVLAGAIWWVLGGSGSRAQGTVAEATTAANEDAPARVPTPAESLAALAPGAETPAAAGTQPVATPAPARAAPSSVASTAATVPPAATPVAAATPPPERREEPPARPTQLRLQINGDSWIEVYDARGERLFADVASAGSVQDFEARPPLRVVLGNAAAVAVRVNGESRDIPAAAVDGDTARFVVNRSGSLSRSRQ